MPMPWEQDYGGAKAPAAADAAMPWEKDYAKENATPLQTPAARIADDFAQLPPSRLGEPMQTREVPRPGAPGGNYSSDITQRARNTAFGQGPGSVQVAGVPVPGIALPAAGALAAGYRALPTEWREKIRTGAVTAGTEGAAGIAKELGAPEPVVEWLKTVALVRMFGRSSKAPPAPAPGRPPFFPPHPEKIWPGGSGTP